VSARSECGAIVVGGSITGLSSLRAFASHGIPVAVVATDRRDVAPYSRWASETHRLDDVQADPESVLDLLERQARRWRGRVVLTNLDEVAILLARHRERLERWYRIVTPPWDTIRHVMQKDLTYAAAREVGVDAPRSYGEASLETAALDDVVFPVVVKPVESRPFVVRFGVKLFVAHDRDELRRRVEDVLAAALRAEIIDLVPGPDDLFYSYTVYIDRYGDPAAELCTRKLRKSPPFFGVARVAEVASRSELREPTLALLRRIGWRGMASVEYKLDPRDGRHRLMEINGRSFLIQGLAQRAGVNYPLLAWRESVLGENVSAAFNGWGGVWIHLLDDLYYGLFHRAVEGASVRQYLTPYGRPKIFAVWSADDPKPFLMQGYHALRHVAAASLDGEIRAALRSHVQGMPAGNGHSRP